MLNWRRTAASLHEQALAAHQHIHDRSTAGADNARTGKGDSMATAAAAISGAILALTAVTWGQMLELRRIRKLLEAAQSTAVAAYNAHGSLVPKEGGSPMPAGPFNPTDTDDVQIVTSPTNAAGNPVSDDFVWTSSDNAAVAVQPSDDKKSCLCVTTPGVGLDVIVTITQPSTGKSESFAIQRTAPPPPDNAVADFNSSGSLVAKV